MVDPPFDGPLFQVIPKVVAVLKDITSFIPIGGSGFVISIPPLPDNEYKELP